MAAPSGDATVVLGSVIMNSANSWYIGPVIGAISATYVLSVTSARTKANTKNPATYAIVMCARLATHRV